jgi:hypothetical protein
LQLCGGMGQPNLDISPALELVSGKGKQLLFQNKIAVGSHALCILALCLLY